MKKILSLPFLFTCLSTGFGIGFVQFMYKGEFALSAQMLVVAILFLMLSKIWKRSS